MLQCLLCRSKNSFRDKSAWKHISAGSHALLRFCCVLIGVSGDPQLDQVQMGCQNLMVVQESLGTRLVG